MLLEKESKEVGWTFWEMHSDFSSCCILFLKNLGHIWGVLWGSDRLWVGNGLCQFGDRLWFKEKKKGESK